MLALLVITSASTFVKVLAIQTPSIRAWSTEMTLNIGVQTAKSANFRQVLAAQVLAPLNQRSNLAGAIRLVAHLAVIVASGYGWATATGWVALLALIVYGISLAFMFCAVHECVHRTAFASTRLNDAIAWLAGLLSFYNSTFTVAIISGITAIPVFPVKILS